MTILQYSSGRITELHQTMKNEEELPIWLPAVGLVLMIFVVFWGTL